MSASSGNVTYDMNLVTTVGDMSYIPITVEEEASVGAELFGIALAIWGKCVRVIAPRQK